MSEPEKACRGCGVVKPLGEFYRHSGRAKDGHANQCKDCKRKYERSKRAEVRREGCKRHYRANPAYYLERNRRVPEDRKLARRALNLAVRDGTIARGPCEVCGELRADGHHADYSRPLDVRWFCRKHHYAIEHGQSHSHI